MIHAEQPPWVFRKLARHLPEFFSPHTIGLYKIQRHTYREALAHWAGVGGPTGIREPHYTGRRFCDDGAMAARSRADGSQSKACEEAALP